jgi:hypothetical protein
MIVAKISVVRYANNVSTPIDDPLFTTMSSFCPLLLDMNAGRKRHPRMKGATRKEPRAMSSSARG